MRLRREKTRDKHLRANTANTAVMDGKPTRTTHRTPQPEQKIESLAARSLGSPIHKENDSHTQLINDHVTVCATVTY